MDAPGGSKVLPRINLLDDEALRLRMELCSPRISEERRVQIVALVW